jgi:hypothetical protein
MSHRMVLVCTQCHDDTIRYYTIRYDTLRCMTAALASVPPRAVATQQSPLGVHGTRRRVCGANYV